jgi:hypothetical protein
LNNLNPANNREKGIIWFTQTKSKTKEKTSGMGVTVDGNNEDYY